MHGQNIKKKLSAVEQEMKKTEAQQKNLEERREKLTQELDLITGDLVASLHKAMVEGASLQKHKQSIEELSAKLSETYDQSAETKEKLIELLVDDTIARRNQNRFLMPLPDLSLSVVRSVTMGRLKETFDHQTDLQENVQKELQSAERDAYRSQSRLKVTAWEKHLSTKRSKDRTLKLQQTEEQSRKNQERLQKLAKDAKSLRDLFAKIERDRKAYKRPSTKTLTPTAKGKFKLPLKGVVQDAFGKSGAVAPFNKGFLIVAQGDTVVTSPSDGQVVFAGDFRSYGKIVILEHKPGHHTLLAGLHDVECTIGQNVLSREPIGSMKSGAKLYVEVRQNGQAVNPKPWWGLQN